MEFQFYPHNKSFECNASFFDLVYVSNIFETNRDNVKIYYAKNINIGGVGSSNPLNLLPKEIDDMIPWYYPTEKISYGFITRGCIRNCYFCKVPKTEGKLKYYCDIEKIIQHKNVKFMDNNFLAYDGHIEILKKLVEMKVKCQFNQGLDYRLTNDDNLYWLSKLNYLGEYTFAFDDIRYYDSINEKIKLIKKYIPADWKLKFYCYFNKNDKIKDLIFRIDWCKEHKCLPYLMRDINCYSDIEERKNFLIDYAAYCNQPSLFKKMKFEEFLIKRLNDKSRIESDLEYYRNGD